MLWRSHTLFTPLLVLVTNLDEPPASDDGISVVYMHAIERFFNHLLRYMRCYDDDDPPVVFHQPFVYPFATLKNLQSGSEVWASSYL